MNFKFIRKQKFLILLTLLVMISCESARIIDQFSDNFEDIQPHWKWELRDTSRIELSSFSKEGIKINLFPQDTGINKGKRTELSLQSKDTLGDIVNYSIKFMFPESFFKENKNKDWIMIHQWHSRPPIGESWADFKSGTHPSVNLAVAVSPGKEYYLMYNYGLWNNEKKDVRGLRYPEVLKPNKWYEFENTIYWEEKDNAYSIPKVNGTFLVPEEEHPEGKIYGANMYNNRPNYLKIGFYGNNANKDSISIFFRDFNYKLIR